MKFIAFFDDKTGRFETYEFDGKGFYTNLATNNGFDVETVKKYGPRFLHSNTAKGIVEEVRKALHQREYGLGDKGDCQCPKCGYWYSFDYYDNNDGYYTPAIIENFSQKINCICGCKFEAKIEVKVKFNTTIL